MLRGDEKVLITGAAGGIGAATARTFAARGHSLILHDRDAERLDALPDDLGALAVVGDLADPSGVDSAITAGRDADIAILGAALPSSGSPRRRSSASEGRFSACDGTWPAPV